MPRALNLSPYLCASVRALPRVPLIRLLRRDLLFLSLAPPRRLQPHPMKYSEGSPIFLYFVIYLTLRF